MERGKYLVSLTLSIFTLLCLTISPAGLAQTYDAEVTTTPLKIADPGEIVTHVFTVHNNGTDSDTYDLTVNLPEDWSMLPIPDQVNVPAGSVRPVFVNVNVPGNAKAEKYDITLTAKSTGDPTLQVSGTAKIQVKSAPGLGLKWEAEPSRIGPGMTVEGRFSVSNNGNLPDRYVIDVTAPDGWTYSLEEQAVRLMPGESRTLAISITAPEIAEPGTRYRIEIKVNSEHDRQLEKTISSTGQLAPPPPERVSAELFPTWDTFTNFNVNQNGQPSFYFSGLGEIPRLGEISANLNLSADGFEAGRLRVMADVWGFVLNGSTISGSYLSTSGGAPLFMAEFDDFSAEFLFTEEGKGLSLEKEGEYLDLRAVLGTDKKNGEVSFQEIDGAYEFSNGVILDGLITSAETQTESGTIVGAGLELLGEKFEIYPSFIKVDPGYPNQSPRLDTRVNVLYDEDEFTTSFGWNYTRTRLGEEPDYYHSTEHRFNVSTSINLGENIDSDFSLGFRRRKSDDKPVSNDMHSNSFSGSISGGRDLTWSIGTNYTSTRDYISDTIVNTHSIDGTLGFIIGESDHSAGISIEQMNIPEGTMVSTSFTLESEFPDFPLSPSFALSKTNNDTMFYADFSDQSPEGISLNISFSASLVKQDSVSLSISSSFPDPFRACGPTKGQVKGYIFLDENGNGRKDPGEEGVQKVLLSLNGEEAISGKGGRFAFPSVTPGKYQLGIEEVRPGLRSEQSVPRTVAVKAGERAEISIPLRPRSWIRGTAYRDANQSGSRNSGEGGMSGVVFRIRGEGITKEVRSGANGRFDVDVSPGTYTIRLDEDSLPERYEATTSTTVRVSTEKYGRTEASFGVYQKPRPVEVTFGPPTAKFTYTPEEPDIGQEILLDGSDSSAIETEITSYEWKLTHAEREITRSEKKFRIRLPEPGKWEISLTVTDKNGLKGKTVKTIMVSQ